MQQASGLHNKRVVILGGSSGIGLAVAEQAESQGAKVVIASSNAERVEKALHSLGGNAQGTRLIFQTNEPSRRYLGALVRSTTWCSPLAIVFVWTTLPTQI